MTTFFWHFTIMKNSIYLILIKFYLVFSCYSFYVRSLSHFLLKLSLILLLLQPIKYLKSFLLTGTLSDVIFSISRLLMLCVYLEQSNLRFPILIAPNVIIFKCFVHKKEIMFYNYPLFSLKSFGNNFTASALRILEIIQRKPTP